MATDGDVAPGGAWRDRARHFAERWLLPSAEAIDREDRVPRELLEELGREGLLGVGLTPEYGGRAGSTADVAAVLEELARGSPAVATMVAVHLSVAAAPVERWGTAEQKERFLRPLAEGRVIGAFALTEASAGSDAARIGCRYEAVPGGFRIRGAKLFITDADLAGVILAFATRDPALGHRGISAFLVSAGTPGLSVTQRLDKLGLRGSTTTELFFDGVALPPDSRLGPEGEGFTVAMEALAGGRIGIAACALGTARAAYEVLVETVRNDPSDAHRAEVARAFVGLEAASGLVGAAASARDAGRPYVATASAAKLAASRLAVEIASKGLELAGRPGARAGSAAERLWRDARVFPIVEGTTEIQELILGRELLGRSGASDPA